MNTVHEIVRVVCKITVQQEERLTALIVDDTLLSLLRVELAQRAVLGILFDISLSRPHPHPTGHAAGRPADPLRHHACRQLCPTQEERKTRSTAQQTLKNILTIYFSISSL